MKRNDGAAAEAPIDLGKLPELTGYLLRRAQLAVFQDFYEAVAGLDLRPAEFSVLLVLAHNPGARQGRVAEALGIQKPNFAVLLRRLVERGLAEQRACASSRRSVELHLTPAGAAFLARAKAAVAVHEARLTARMGTAHRAALLEILRTLAQ